MSADQCKARDLRLSKATPGTVGLIRREPPDIHFIAAAFYGPGKDEEWLSQRKFNDQSKAYDYAARIIEAAKDRVETGDDR